MRNAIILFLASCVVGGGARAASILGAPQSNPQGSANTSSGSSNAAAQSAQASAAYKIGPHDVLQIDVWKEPEITRSVQVRPDGKITLPLLNDVQAAGLTPMELAHRIREGLKKYINDPQVTVTVEQINSRRV